MNTRTESFPSIDYGKGSCLVCIIAIKDPKASFSVDSKTAFDFLDFSYPTWKFWCKKNKISLKIIHHISESHEFSKLPANYTRYFIDKIVSNFQDYHRIAIIDSDIMVHWNSPNIFDVCGSNFGAVKDGHLKYIENSTRYAKKYFKNVEVDPDEYINSGVLIFGPSNERHVNLFKKTQEFFLKNKDGMKKKQWKMCIRDQTPFNYLIKANNIEVNFMKPSFNSIHLADKGMLNNGSFLENAYLWHFNRSRDYYFYPNDRYHAMKKVWNYVKSAYNEKESEDLDIHLNKKNLPRFEKLSIFKKLTNKIKITIFKYGE